MPTLSSFAEGLLQLRIGAVSCYAQHAVWVFSTRTCTGTASQSRQVDRAVPWPDCAQVCNRTSQHRARACRVNRPMPNATTTPAGHPPTAARFSTSRPQASTVLVLSIRHTAMGRTSTHRRRPSSPSFATACGMLPTKSEPTTPPAVSCSSPILNESRD